MNSITPRKFALVVAIVTSVILLAALHLAFDLLFSATTWFAFTAIFVLIFIITFIVFSYSLNRFSQRIIISSGAKQSPDDKDGFVPRREPSTINNSNQTDEIAELKKLETFRKEFLGNVSHELKTPIFGIQGYIHTLLDGAIHDDEVNVQYLKRAAASAERLSLIVDDLEAISKLEGGELILDQRTFDIYELTKDVYDSIELRAREKDISLKFIKGSDHSFYVYADKERIRQVLVNLIMNSIKYGKPGGTTKTAFYDSGENVLVEIADDGIGIEIQNMPRVFERFFRVDKSRSREAGGTGLGLSIVKHILEAHKQTINVRSTYGTGTTFTFTLKKSK